LQASITVFGPELLKWYYHILYYLWDRRLWIGED